MDASECLCSDSRYLAYVYGWSALCDRSSVHCVTVWGGVSRGAPFVQGLKMLAKCQLSSWSPWDTIHSFPGVYTCVHMCIGRQAHPCSSQACDCLLCSPAYLNAATTSPAFRLCTYSHMQPCLPATATHAYVHMDTLKHAPTHSHLQSSGSGLSGR